MVYALVGVFCIFSETVFPFFLKVSHDTLGSQQVLQGLLRCLGGGITRGDAVGYPVGPGGLVVHHSRRRGLAVASLEETQGLLSRFDRVYSGYSTSLKGAQGVLWRLL